MEDIDGEKSQACCRSTANAHVELSSCSLRHLCVFSSSGHESLGNALQSLPVLRRSLKELYALYSILLTTYRYILDMLCI